MLDIINISEEELHQWDTLCFEGSEVWSSLSMEIESSQSLDVLKYIVYKRYLFCTKPHKQILAVYDVVLILICFIL